MIGIPMNDFVICINNDSNPASLIVGKVYRTRPDSDAEGHQMLRVIDEDWSEPDGYLPGVDVRTDRIARSGRAGFDDHE